MTKEQFDTKMHILVTKRDQAADVVGNVLLALTYQQDIDKLVDQWPQYASVDADQPGASR